MLCWLFGVINYDVRFVEYFSCFSFGMIALGMVLKLNNEFMNHVAVSYLIVSIYLLARQFIWMGTYGLCADYTYLDPNVCGAPFWVHLVMHGIPVPLVFSVMVEKKITINGKYTIVYLIIYERVLLPKVMLKKVQK